MARSKCESPIPESVTQARGAILRAGGEYGSPLTPVDTPSEGAGRPAPTSADPPVDADPRRLGSIALDEDEPALGLLAGGEGVVLLVRCGVDREFEAVVAREPLPDGLEDPQLARLVHEQRGRNDHP